MSEPIKCMNCQHVYSENNFMGFTLPYGFKSVKLAEIRLWFCPKCENIQFADAETKAYSFQGGFNVEE